MTETHLESTSLFFNSNGTRITGVIGLLKVIIPMVEDNGAEEDRPDELKDLEAFCKVGLLYLHVSCAYVPRRGSSRFKAGCRGNPSCCITYSQALLQIAEGAQKTSLTILKGLEILSP